MSMSLLVEFGPGFGVLCAGLVLIASWVQHRRRLRVRRYIRNQKR